ncbi:MAG: ATP-dependent DNA helicase [Myxococcales bacterium]|nr:ATP-dependent DNA helicase [Myxococcales bacterium]
MCVSALRDLRRRQLVSRVLIRLARECVSVVSLRLNPSQRDAVAHDRGPMLVLAGAGSGKTGVVTQRIARLIREGTPARAILAMTFTNKAAGEMQQRVEKLAGKKATNGLLACTFHRFGLEVLSRETKVLGLRCDDFAIFDRGDATAVVRDALRLQVTGKTYDVGAIVNRISLAKNAFLDPEAYAKKHESSGDEYDAVTAEIYPRYAAALKSLQAYDFDDLVCEPVRLWLRLPEVLERWRRRFTQLIVDEYQDTNLAQLEMLRLLATEHRNVMVVGDDDQAIYAWRGADVRNILDFEQHFTGARVVRLEHNYRSSEAVLEVANAVLAASHSRRHGKTLRGTKGTGERVKRVSLPDGTSEAVWVAEQIAELLAKEGVRPRDVAVLYRSNLQAPEFESELRARGVPFRVYGGTETFERKEVKDVLSYLSVALAPHDNELAVRRTLNYPSRGIGDAGLDRLGAFATAYGTSLFAAIEKSYAVPELSAVAREGCRAYALVVLELQRDIERLAMPQALESVVERIGLKAQLAVESGSNVKAFARRWASIELLIKIFSKRAQKLLAMPEKERPLPRLALAQFLRILTLRMDDDDDGAGEKVTLSTMHGSKGLEYRYVFAVGLEEGLLPHARVTDVRATDAMPLDGQAIDEVEQERRLFYVCITRAQEQLWLTHADSRLVRGKPQRRVPSRFLLDIPDALLDKVDVLAPPRRDPTNDILGAENVLSALRSARNPI